MSAMNSRLALAATVGNITVNTSCAQMAPKKTTAADLGSWPKGCSPREVGRRMADRFVVSPHPTQVRPGRAAADFFASE